MFFTLTGSRFSIFFLLSIVKSYFKWTLSLIRYASTFFASSSENYPWNSDSVLKISNIVKYCAIAIITLIFFTQKEIINIFLNIFFFFFYFLKTNLQIHLLIRRFNTNSHEQMLKSQSFYPKQIFFFLFNTSFMLFLGYFAITTFVSFRFIWRN